MNEPSVEARSKGPQYRYSTIHVGPSWFRAGVLMDILFCRINPSLIINFALERLCCDRVGGSSSSKWRLHCCFHPEWLILSLSLSLSSPPPSTTPMKTPLSEYRHEGLTIVVIGASGHLARVKIMPSLYNLSCLGLLPPNTLVCGYARSKITTKEWRESLKENLVSLNHEKVQEFLNTCVYIGGDSYSDVNAFQTLAVFMQQHEQQHPECIKYNRMFYLAVPPNVFCETSMVRV